MSSKFQEARRLVFITLSGYEAIRDKFLEHKDPKMGKAMSLKDAKKHTAMVWNSTHAGTGQTVGNGRKKRKR